MANADILWQQRFENYSRALARLNAAVALAHERPLSDLERQGLIHAFEFTHELSWKTLKDFLTSRGVADLFGSKDTTREAFAQGLIDDGECGMAMINEIAVAVTDSYQQAFQQLQSALAQRQQGGL